MNTCSSFCVLSLIFANTDSVPLGNGYLPGAHLGTGTRWGGVMFPSKKRKRKKEKNRMEEVFGKD